MSIFTHLTVLAGEGGTGIFGGFTSFLQKLPTEMKAFGIALAVVCAGFLGFCLMGGGGEAIQRHKKWAIGIAGGLILICVAPTVVPAIANMAG